MHEVQTGGLAQPERKLPYSLMLIDLTVQTTSVINTFPSPLRQNENLIKVAVKGFGYDITKI